MTDSTPWQRATGFSAVVVTLIALGVVLHQLGGILIPFILAGFLSILFNPFVGRLRSMRIPLPIAILIVMCIVGGALWLVFLVLSQSIDSFIGNIDFYTKQMKVLISDLERSTGSFMRSVGSRGTFRLNKIMSAETLTSFATAQIWAIMGLVGDGVMILLFLLFMLGGSAAFPSKILTAFSPENGSKVLATFQLLSKKVRHYLVMKTMFALANGIIMWLVLSAFGVDFAPLFGLLTFMFQYIPNIGSMISTILPTIVFLLQTGSVANAASVAITMALIQNILGNLVEPKVIGDQLKLSPVVVLSALLFWGWMWGVVGMILSIPIMAFCKILLEIIPTTRPIAVLMGSKPARSRPVEPGTA